MFSKVLLPLITRRTCSFESHIFIKLFHWFLLSNYVWPVLNNATTQNEPNRAKATQNNKKQPKSKLKTTKNKLKRVKRAQKETLTDPKTSQHDPKTSQNEPKQAKTTLKET